MGTLDGLFGRRRGTEDLVDDPAVANVQHTREKTRETVDPNSDGTGVDNDLPDVSARLARLEANLEAAENRIRDKDVMIGQLESDRNSWRQAAQMLETSPEKEPETNPFDDPQNQEFLQQIADDPVKLSKVVASYAEARAQELMDQKLAPVQAQLETYAASQALMNNVQSELATARGISPEAAAIVDEAINSNWTSGVLVEAIQQNKEVVTYKGGLSNLIARLASTQTVQPTSIASTQQPSSRPKARTQSLSGDNDEPTDEEIEQAYVNRILHATKGRKLPFQ